MNGVFPGSIGFFRICLITGGLFLSGWLLAADHPVLKVSGLEGEVLDNVRHYFDLSQYECDIADWRLQQLEKSARRKVQEALQALGYYHASIDLLVARDNGCWTLKVNAQAGPQVHISDIQLEVSGKLAQTAGYKSLRRHFPLHVGDALNHLNYQKTKTGIEILASRYGFFDGKFSVHRLIVNPVTNLASVILKFDSGPRYHFGPVKVLQNQFSDRFFKQYVLIKPGDEYDSQKLTEQQQLLSDSGYFSEVDLSVDRKPSENRSVPVEITLKARKRHAYRIGLGASTNEGARFSLKFDNRWVNKLGHRYIFDSSWSEVVSEQAFNYTIPLGDSGQYKLDLGIGNHSEHTDTSRSTRTQAGIVLSKIMRSGWTRSISLDGLRENFTTADSKDTVQLFIPGLGYSKVVRDNPMFPRHGWRLSVKVKTAFDGFLSDVDLIQLTGTAKLVRPVKRGRILARGAAGLTEVSDFSKLPASLRFYAGGDNSVRGFDYKSLGPTNSAGEVIGGKNMLAGSLEYEHPVKGNFGAAIFVDAGNAFNDFNDYEIRSAYGFGVRYHSPIGPIRLDLARELKNGGAAIRVHLSMGPDL